MDSKLQNVVLIYSISLLLSSCLYLTGYWRYLGFDVFDYIDVSDIVKVSIYPLTVLTLFTYVVLGCYVTYVAIILAIKSQAGWLSGISFKDISDYIDAAKVDNKYVIFCILLSIPLSILGTWLIDVTFSLLFIFVILLIAFFSLLDEGRIPILLVISGNRLIQRFFAIPLVVCVLFSYHYGMFMAAVVSSQDIRSELSGEKESLIDVGVVGDYFVLIDSLSGKIIIIRRDSVKRMSPVNRSYIPLHRSNWIFY